MPGVSAHLGGTVIMPLAIDPNSKLLGSPPADLVLRISRSSLDHAPQSLRLPESKCTVGADPACTIATDYALHPVHCLILRGPRGAVVRRWAPDTLLNGAPFDDAPLHEGDQLTIGDDVVEVIDLGIGPASKKETSGLVAAPKNGLHETTETTENAALAKLRAARDIARQRSRSLLAELRKATTARREQQAIAESAVRTSDASKDHSRQLENTLQNSEHALAESRSLLHALQEELQQKHNAWDAEREELRNPQAEQELALQIHDLTQKWTLSGFKLRLLQDVLFESGRFWLKQQTEETPAVASDRISEENEALRQELDRLGQSHQIEADEALQARQTLQSELATFQAELQASREEAQRLEQERESLQAIQARSDQDLESLRSELQASLKETQRREQERQSLQSLQTRSDQDLESLRSELKASLKEARRREQERQNLQAQSDQDLESLRSELQASREEALRVEQERQDLQSRYEDLCRQRNDVRCEAIAEAPTPERLEADASLAAREQAAPAVDVDEQFKGGGSEHALPRGESVATNGEEDSASEGEAEEDSIKAYMSQLLQRLKSDTDSTPRERPQASQAAPASTPEPEEVSPEPSPSNEVLQEPPCEMPPRRPAPDQSLNLEAMRDLANSSARQAINKHARKLAVAELGAKLALVATAATSTAYLAFYSTGGSAVMYASAAVTSAVALVWGRQVLLIFRGGPPTAKEQSQSEPEKKAPAPELPESELPETDL